MSNTTQTKKFRIAVSGVSTDWGVNKRFIQASSLIEMAKNYNPEIYKAQLWDEHIKGWSKTSEFVAFGEVLELSTEDFKVRDETRTALYAEVKPYNVFLNALKNDFNKFFSIEIDSNFSDFESAYLTGLGLVTEPGSIGSEMAHFAKEGNKNNELFLGEKFKLDGTNTQRESIFERVNELLKKNNQYTNPPPVTRPKETEICPGEFTKEKNTLLERINSMFKKDKQDAPTDIEKSVEALAENFKKESESLTTELESLKKENEGLKAEFSKLNDSINVLTDNFQRLSDVLDKTPANEARKPHEGDSVDTENLASW